MALIPAVALIALLLSASSLHAQEIVDPRSGRLFLTVTDIVVNAGAVSLEVHRSLDTRRNEAGLLGTRWRLNWESRLFHYGELVVIEEGSGSIAFTRAAGKPEYTSGSGERLVTEADGRVVRTGLDGTKDVFDPRGRLVERDLRNGNRFALRYGAEGRLSRIEGPGRSFVELSTDKTGKVVRVQTSSGDIVRYGYVDEGLTEVQLNGGPTLRYGYDATGALGRIEDPRSGAVQLAYDAKGRVLSRRWADGSQQRYEYDDAANSVRLVDPAGGINTMIWSQDNQRVEITSPLGHKSVIEYDAAGRILAATGPTGAVVRNRYDALGRTVAVEAPSGQQTRFEYLGDTSWVKTIIQPDGTRRTFEYDSQGNLTTAKVGAEILTALTYHPDGSVATVQGWGQPARRFAYHPDGRLKAVTNALGETSQLEYDNRGNLIRETNPLGGVTLRSYDPHDRLVSLTDPSGQTTRYAPDAVGRLSEIIDPAGGAARYNYDARGRVVAETHPSGQTSRYEYDPAGRLARVIRPGGRVESVRYDAAGNVTESVDGLGRSTTFEYDALGRVTRERRPTGLEIRYRYDSLGSMVGVEDSTGAKTQFQRDSFGRLTGVTDPLGATGRYQHDALGNVVASIDPRGQTQSFTYTASGAVASAREPSGDAARYDYDPAGRVVAVHHPGGGVTRLAYDAMGNLLRVTDPLGSQRIYTYDVAGRRTSATDAAGRITRYVFDPHGRLAEKQLPDGKRIAYQYNALGNLVQVDDGAFPVRYTYDRLDRLARVEYPAIRKWVEYEYDAQGLQTKLTDSERRETRYEYGAWKQLAAILLPDGKRIAFDYDVWNRPQSIRYPNGVSGLWEYNPAGRIAKLSYRDRNGNIVAGWDYRYDAAGNLIERQDSQGRTSRFQYDPAEQLTDETGPAGATRYRYGAGGNRAAVEAGGGTTRYLHDAGDRLLEAGGEQLTFDANGNVIARQGPGGKTVYTYDAADRLVQVRAPDGSETAFGYAPTGERISKRDKDGLRYYLYSGLDLIQELGETGTPIVTYIHGPGTDRPLAMLRDGRYYFYHADRLGSVALVTDERGQPVAAYDYDAFGKLSMPPPSVPNPFTFTGREWDASTGLYYHRARYYDPALGRFLSTDPLPARLGDPLPLNPYLYVRNNPLRFVDPLGLEESWPTGIGAGWENITSPDLPPAPRAGNPPMEYDPYWEYQYWRAVAARGGPGAEEAAQAAQVVRQQMIDADIPIEPRVGTKPTVTSDTLSRGARQPGSTLRGPSSNQPTLSGDGPLRAPIPEGQTIRISPNQPRVLPLRGGVSTGFVPAPPQVTVTGVAGGVGTVVGVTAIGLDYAACLAEGKSPEACKKELTDKLPWLAGGTVVGGVLMFTPAAPFVAVGGAGLALWGLNNAGNRWANAPEVQALQALLVSRLQGIEGRIGRLERQHTEMVNARNQAANSAREAKDSADAAAGDLATARGLASQILNAAAACKNADALAQQINAYASDVEKSLNMLKTGLPAAASMMAACTKKEDVEWVKNLYETGKGVVAEMMVKAGQAESRNEALNAIRSAAQGADTARAQAAEAVERIRSNAPKADASAEAAAGAATTAGSLASQLPADAAVLRGEIDGFPPAIVQNLAEGWRGRLSAAAAIPPDVQDVNAFVSPARAEASRAKDLLAQGSALLASLPNPPVCGPIPTADDAIARIQAAVTDATSEMYFASDLPSKADACLASLTTPGGGTRSLMAFWVSCPPEVQVGGLVTCTASGVWSDNPGKGEDMTSGLWDPIGPQFTAPTTPGPVVVTATRFGLTDSATVTVKAAPRVLQSLSVSCSTPEAEIGQLVTCTASGVYSDNPSTVDLSSAPTVWETGPQFTAVAPQPSYLVKASREGLTGATTVKLKAYNPLTDPLATGGFGAGPVTIPDPTAPGGTLPGPGPGGAGVPPSGAPCGVVPYPPCPPGVQAGGQPTGLGGATATTQGPYNAPPAGSTTDPTSTSTPPGGWCQQVDPITLASVLVPCVLGTGQAGQKPVDYRNLTPVGGKTGGGSSGGTTGGMSGGGSSGGSGAEPPCPAGTAREASEPQKGCH